MLLYVRLLRQSGQIEKISAELNALRIKYRSAMQKFKRRIPRTSEKTHPKKRFSATRLGSTHKPMAHKKSSLWKSRPFSYSFFSVSIKIFISIYVSINVLFSLITVLLLVSIFWETYFIFIINIILFFNKLIFLIF